MNIRNSHSFSLLGIIKKASTITFFLFSLPNIYNNLHVQFNLNHTAITYILMPFDINKVNFNTSIKGAC